MGPNAIRRHFFKHDFGYFHCSADSDSSQRHNFDYISPMIYPSHYRAPYAGCQNPVLCPYAVVNKTMKEGADIMASSTTPVIGKSQPWLQDFNLGAIYTADMVRA